MSAAVCSRCPTSLGARNRSGLCRPCSTKRTNADPVLQALRKAGIRARFADPVFRAKHAARAAASNRNISDEVRESRRRHGRLRAATLNAAAAAALTPEMRAANGRKRSDTTLAWCPPEWRDRYRDLKRRGRRAATAKRLVLDMIAGKPAPLPWAKQKTLAWCPPDRRAEYQRLRAKVGAAAARSEIEADLTWFERQMARVAAGASLITVHPMRKPGPEYTLGGIASADF